MPASAFTIPAVTSVEGGDDGGEDGDDAGDKEEGDDGVETDGGGAVGETGEVGEAGEAGLSGDVTTGGEIEALSAVNTLWIPGVTAVATAADDPLPPIQSVVLSLKMK